MTGINIPVVDPMNPLNFNRNNRELEAFFIFTVFVAGKTARIIKRKSHCFYRDLVFSILENNKIKNSEGVFDYIKQISNEHILFLLKKHKIGRYTFLIKFFDYIKNNYIDLFNCTIQDLEKIPCVGKKTSRFFVMYSKETNNIAILDRHILTYLNKFKITDIKNTPTGKMYDDLEKQFIYIFEKYSNFKGNLYDFDLAIWKNKGDLLGCENLNIKKAV